uniref:Uncharacterized protein n=1 Tax=Tanacetum cinerariifolium TaxID=118510 RepID=A0A6L2L8R5_TANCI|nr:hypothetical protein [Tanacetum cinerariifolium]
MVPLRKMGNGCLGIGWSSLELVKEPSRLCVDETIISYQIIPVLPLFIDSVTITRYWNCTLDKFVEASMIILWPTNVAAA